MAYIVVRNNVSGSVSLVEKRRVKNPDGSSSVRDVSIVCGLGVMSKEDFTSYQKWAHGIKDQNMRKEAVLGSHACAYHKARAAERADPVKRTTKRVTEGKAKRVTKPRAKKPAVRKSYPVPTLKGYKGQDATKTHTQIMQERKKQRRVETEMREQARPDYVPPKATPTARPASKFSPEGVAFSTRSKKRLAQERVFAKRARQ